MVPYKVLCINDLSVFGRARLGVITPVVSRLGVQPVSLPTRVLSTHFGFKNPRIVDLTDFCMDTLDRYEKMGLKFDCVFSGFLSNVKQVEMVRHAYKLAGENLKICDPAMADHGKLYSSVTEELAAGFKILRAERDLITPNPTEAMILLGQDCSEREFSKSEISDAAKELSQNKRSVVITGVSLSGGEKSLVGYDAEKKEIFYHTLHYVPVSFPGTGDTFDACLAGMLTKGADLRFACRQAAEFVETAAKSTYLSGDNKEYGIHIEPFLKDLRRWETKSESFECTERNFGYKRR
jgi:pyridoxine kinase